MNKLIEITYLAFLEYELFSWSLAAIEGVEIDFWRSGDWAERYELLFLFWCLKINNVENIYNMYIYVNKGYADVVKKTDYKIIYVQISFGEIRM